MEPRPAHLGEEYPRQFCDPSVAAAYPHRPPYPAAVYPLLVDLVVGPSRTVLDIGCGTGDIARGLAPLVERADAVDISAPMIALGRTLPGGDHPHLGWIQGRAEDVPTDVAYGLVTAGESLHWMEWDILLPRLRRLLVPGGVVALVGRGGPLPWDGPVAELIDRYSTNRDFRPYNLVDELVRRGLFAPLGEVRTEPVAFRQSVDAYIESMHSRNGFSRDRMEPSAAAAFDRGMAEVLDRFAEDGELLLRLAGSITWGLPAA